ncbi:class I SAM-dependent methyltransferase [Candidatus Peregrinibacteria bacterium]|nr:MAG: class I SAM-dependent methyltransferase [Candidatus Peregrinibacteria bacterium]
MGFPFEENESGRGSHDVDAIAKYLMTKNPIVETSEGGSVLLSECIDASKGKEDGEALLSDVLAAFLKDSGEETSFYRALARHLMRQARTGVREEFAEIRKGGVGAMIAYLRDRNPVIQLPEGQMGELIGEHLKDPEHLREVGGQYARMLDFYDAKSHNEAGVARIAGALRYFLEGRENTYNSDASFYRFLAERFLGELPPENRRMLDLGCGNAAQKLAEWDTLVDNNGLRSLGIDGSTTFALRNAAETQNIAVGAIDAETSELRRQVGEALNSQFGIVLANLVLDRVADPTQLIRNMNAFLVPGGKAVLGCLLPNTGEDDEQLPDPLQHIVYTPTENRVTEGKHPYSDAKQIRKHIEAELGVKVKVIRQPYHWKSSGGEGVYDKHFIFEWTKPKEV